MKRREGVEGGERELSRFDIAAAAETLFYLSLSLSLPILTHLADAFRQVGVELDLDASLGDRRGHGGRGRSGGVGLLGGRRSGSIRRRFSFGSRRSSSIRRLLFFFLFFFFFGRGSFSGGLLCCCRRRRLLFCSGGFGHSGLLGSRGSLLRGGRDRLRRRGIRSDGSGGVVIVDGGGDDGVGFAVGHFRRERARGLFRA